MDRCILQWRTNFQLDEDDMKRSKRKFRPVCWETLGWVAMTIQNAHGGMPVTGMCDGGREAQKNAPRFVTGGGDKTVRLWQQPPSGGYGMPIQLLKVGVKCVPLDIMDVMLSEKFIIGSNLGNLVEVDLQVDGKVPALKHPRTLLSGHSGAISVVAAHPRKRIIATTSNDKTVRIWDVEQHKLIAMARLTHRGLCADWSATGKLLAIGLSNGILVVLRVTQSGKKLEVSFEKYLRPVDPHAPRLKLPQNCS